MNQVKKNLESWDEDELLFVTSKDIHYFFFHAFLLVLGKTVVFDSRSSSTAWKCVKK